MGGKGQPGRSLSSDTVVVVVEGFLLFFKPSLCDMFNAHIWVEADCDTCMIRLHKRGKQSRKKEVEASADWFRGLVWPHHKKNRRPQLRNASDALRLDATRTTKELLDEAATHCRRLLRRRA